MLTRAKPKRRAKHGQPPLKRFELHQRRHLGLWPHFQILKINQRQNPFGFTSAETDV